MAREFSTPRRYFEIEFLAVGTWYCFTGSFDSQGEAIDEISNLASILGPGITNFRVILATVEREVIVVNPSTG